MLKAKVFCYYVIYLFLEILKNGFVLLSGHTFCLDVFFSNKVWSSRTVCLFNKKNSIFLPTLSYHLGSILSTIFSAGVQKLSRFSNENYFFSLHSKRDNFFCQTIKESSYVLDRHRIISMWSLSSIKLFTSVIYGNS